MTQIKGGSNDYIIDIHEVNETIMHWNPPWKLDASEPKWDNSVKILDRGVARISVLTPYSAYILDTIQDLEDLKLYQRYNPSKTIDISIV